MKAIWLVALTIAACHDADPPVAAVTPAPTASASTPPAPSVVPSSAASTSDKTPESCAAATAAKPDFATCKWTIEKSRCVCNGCLVDSDCKDKPGGGCTSLQAHKPMFPAAKACLYPGDDCFGGAACPRKGTACNHDAMGHATKCGAQGDDRSK